MQSEKDWRPLDEDERRVIEFMLSRLEQEHHYLDDGGLLEVRWLCEPEHCPSIEFRTNRGVEQEAHLRQCDARGINAADGEPFDVMLFDDTEGHLSMLEFIPYGDANLSHLPAPEDLVFDR